MGPNAMIFFWMLSFKPAFSLSSFNFIKRLFSSTSLSAISVVITWISEVTEFFPRKLYSSLSFLSPAFHMMYSAYKLNKQGENIQSWHTPFSILNLSVVAYLVLTVASWPEYRFLRRLVRWSSSPVVVIQTVKGFSVVNEREVDVFLESPSFFYDPADVGNLISGSSAFSKSSLNIWKFSVHILLKPSLKDFEHYSASMWNDFNFAVVWTFSGIAFLWDWNEN